MSDVFIDPTSPTNFLIKFLYYVGLWPQNGKFLYNFYTFIFQLIFSFLYTTFKWIHFLHLEDVRDLFQTLFVCLEETSACIKVINIYWHLKLVNKCLLLINEFKYVSKDERHLLKSTLKLFNTIRIWYYGIAGMATILSYLAPLFSQDVKLMYPAWYPIDWKHNRLYYWLIYVYQAVGIFIMVNTLVTIELYAIYFLMIIKLQFTILGVRLTKIGCYNNNNDNNNNNNKNNNNSNKINNNNKNNNSNNSNNSNIRNNTMNTHAEEANAVVTIINCIKTHKLTLRLVSYVEEIFTIPFFVQFGVSGIVLCVSAFQITFISSSEDITEFLFYFCFVMTMLTQIFVPCYFGSDILIKSNALTIDTYNSNWLGLSPFYRKYIIIFRERLKQPTMIKVGGIFELSLYSFSSILNKSYSLFAVLQSFVKRE